jgi:hypothetical protein
MINKEILKKVFIPVGIVITTLGASACEDENNPTQQAPASTVTNNSSNTTIANTTPENTVIVSTTTIAPTTTEAATTLAPTTTVAPTTLAPETTVRLPDCRDVGNEGGRVVGTDGYEYRKPTADEIEAGAPADSWVLVGHPGTDETTCDVYL